MPDTILNLDSDNKSLLRTSDDWQRLDESQPPPAELPARLLVSLAYWQDNQTQLQATDQQLGLELENTVDVETLTDILPHFAMVALQFPAFTDGRAYSQARALRERMQFTGDIRACGDVLSDQLLYMSRCGFSSFAFANDAVPAHVDIALGEFSCSYQPVTYGPALKKAG